MQLSAGKLRRLASMADDHGRFKMLAIDQRGSLRQAVGEAAGKSSAEVSDDEMGQAKEIVTKVLAPYATAVLTDPVYGYPHSYQHIPPRVGLLLAYEETGYERAGTTGRERKSFLIPGWSVQEAQHAGADAVKLLIYYHPDASEMTVRYQQELVQRVGEECDRTGMPFLLELLSYALNEDGTDTPEYARKKPELVVRSAAEFSKPEYRVDVLKLEFPADLKRTKEFSGGAFDGKERQAVYALSDVREFCRQLNQAAETPWVILSAGVGIEEFLVQVDLATEAGASGFLCGRAIWKDAIRFYPDVKKTEDWLRTQGAYNFVRANAYAHRALAWSYHRRFGAGKPLMLVGE